MPSLPAGILPADLDWAAVDKLARRYALGVPLIDRQHRMLFAWYVSLRDAPDAQQVADGLLAYASRHFADEETWAFELGLEIAVHQQRHDQLLANLEMLQDGAQRSHVTSLAFEWLTIHIDVEDRALVEQHRIAVETGRIRRPPGGVEQKPA